MTQWGSDVSGRGYERAYPKPEGSTGSWCELHKRKKLTPTGLTGDYICNVCDFLARKKAAADGPH